MKRILVGWDASECAVAALMEAVRLAEAVRGEVRAVAVIPEVRSESAEDRAAADAVNRARVVEPFARQLDALRQQFSVVPSLDVVVGTHVAEVLTDYAIEHGFDVIAVGQHGSYSARHPRLGHVTGHVVGTEGCTALVVPRVEAVMRPSRYASAR